MRKIYCWARRKPLRVMLRLLIAAFSLALLSPALAAIEAYQFESDSQEALFRELTAELRCPKCQNQNIADSNAGLAQDLRAKVYEMVKQGQSKDQVVEYMVARYGDFVHYQPPSGAATVIIAAPLLLIMMAILVVMWRVRAGHKVAADASVDQEKVQRVLAATVEQVSAAEPSSSTGTKPLQKDRQ